MITKQLAGCVIMDESEMVLLIHRNTARLTQWELAGGKVEPVESLKHAALREAHEELGVKVKVGKELGSASFEDDGVIWEYHWFKAEIITGAPKIMEPDKFDVFAYFDLLDQNLEIREKLSPNIINLIAFLNGKGKA